MLAPFTLATATTLEVVPADALAAGDHLANLGIVESVIPHGGAFVQVEYTARQWLPTGQAGYTRRSIVLHRADDVAVAR